MRLDWESLKEELRQSYWFIPSVIAACAAVLAQISIHFEHVFSSVLGNYGWFYTRDAQGARQLLSTVGGSLITVTGVIFSITLVALTNASSGFGSRILRNFARDTGNKVVLGAFVGTFLYCVLVLRTVIGGEHAFVPNMSVLIAIILAVICFGLLIYFIHHVVEMLQSDNVVANLARNLEETLDRLYPERFGHSARQQCPPVPAEFDERSTPIASHTSGYIDSIDTTQLMNAAKESDAIVEVLGRPGDFVIAGATIARIYPGARNSDRMVRKLVDSFSIAPRRGYVQDLGFAFEQLQLVAIRALSPAMNNQILAMTCIDRVVQGLAYLGDRDLPSAFRVDNHGTLRVIAHPISHREAVALATNLIAESAAYSPSVTCHAIYRVLRAAEHVRSPDLCRELLAMAHSLGRRALQHAKDEQGRAALNQALVKLSARMSLPRLQQDG